MDDFTALCQFLVPLSGPAPWRTVANAIQPGDVCLFLGCRGDTITRLAGGKTFHQTSSDFIQATPGLPCLDMIVIGHRPKLDYTRIRRLLPRALDRLHPQGDLIIYERAIHHLSDLALERLDDLGGGFARYSQPHGVHRHWYMQPMMAEQNPRRRLWLEEFETWRDQKML